MRILDAIKDMLPEKSAVQMVSDDPQMAAEILLLVRMMFADGELSGEELALFKQICGDVFAINEDEVPSVIEYLRDFGYETSAEQAASEFSNMSDERRKLVLKHLISMARADQEVQRDEVALIARISRVLGVTAEEIRSGL